MVEASVIDSIRRYLEYLPNQGIHARQGILFGSFARGEQREWSDIDLVVIAPEFDSCRDLDFIKKLWRAASRTDDRIEPIPCGVLEWERDGSRPILEIARREGIVISL